MTEEEALEELTKRAAKNNLYLGLEGLDPPGPVIITNDEVPDVLSNIRGGLKAGCVRRATVNKRNRTPSWEAYDEEAIVIMKKLIPYFVRNKGPIITTKLCYARELISRWRCA